MNLFEPLTRLSFTKLVEALFITLSLFTKLGNPEVNKFWFAEFVKLDVGILSFKKLEFSFTKFVKLGLVIWLNEAVFKFVGTLSTSKVIVDHYSQYLQVLV